MIPLADGRRRAEHGSGGASGSRAVVAVVMGGCGGENGAMAAISDPKLGVVVAVSCSATHSMAKPNLPQIQLLAGLGVEGDAHAGVTVKHRSRVAIDPNQPNLRQLHVIHAELHEELVSNGFSIAPGEMGENITTRGVDLLALPTGARLHFGASAVVEVTGLRNPCGQLNGIARGLMAAVIERDAAGNVIRRKAGVMGIVVAGGEVRPGDVISVELPAQPHRALVAV